ncbi:MAG: hypothetical protein KKF56_04205 [Nanoarchaeota archaeon]|nr:hypothetical protein [Nanoarchaeota archaeon]
MKARAIPFCSLGMETLGPYINPDGSRQEISRFRCDDYLEQLRLRRELKEWEIKLRGGEK